MDDVMTKAKLIETLRAKRARWEAALAKVPPNRMIQGHVTGYWSVKDLIAHLASYERWYADRLQENLQGIVYTPQATDMMDVDARNDVFYRRFKEMSLAEVREFEQTAFDDLMRGVDANSEAFLTEPQIFQGAPGPMLIWQMLRGDVYDHYDLHIPQIEAWAAKQHA
jgi:hypothetical protein